MRMRFHVGADSCGRWDRHLACHHRLEACATGGDFVVSSVERQALPYKNTGDSQVMKHSFFQRIMKTGRINVGIVPILILGLVFLISAPASAAITSVTPSTWNVVGLDSNTPAFGPQYFPVGAKVCSDSNATNVVVTFTLGQSYDSNHNSMGTNYIDYRSGALQSVTIPSISAGGCADAYFEVQVTQSSSAFNTSRAYSIAAGGKTSEVTLGFTPELYVEHLVSQSRNYVNDVKLNNVSIPAGGSMSLMVDNTYDIKLVSKTATQGYEQLEAFINFPNTIFQVLSVSTDYTAYGGSVPATGHKYVYADGCTWENDPNSPNYRACNGDGKAGGTITTTYTVKILSGSGTSQTLSSLIYDFSGSSFHYNADFSTGARIANIVGPSSVTIKKTFSPKAISPGGTSTMTFKLTNPTSETLTGVNFTDSAGWPAGLTVSSPGTTTVCGGTLVTTANSASFSGGTLSPNSICTINISVTAATAGNYPNTTGNLYINSTVDTGNTGSDTLTASSAPSCTAGQTLAKWVVPSGTTIPPDATGGIPLTGNKASDVNTATASANLSAKSGSNTTGSADADSIPNDSTSWETYGYKDAGQYVLFVVDTSKYSGVSMNFDAKNSNNGPTAITVSYSTDGTNYTNQYTINSPSTAGFVSHTPDFTGVTSTAGNTYFKIAGTGAQTNNSGNGYYLDEILFTGCRVAIPPPTISKSFLSDPIAKGGTSTLRFVISNTSAGNQALNGVTITDTFPTLPAGMTVASPLTTTNTCGGTLRNNSDTAAVAAGDPGIKLTGGSLAAGGSCTIDVTVTGVTEGDYENVSGYVSATESGANSSASGYATDTLTVVAPPTIAKSFSPASIYTGNTSTLTFTITNPNSASSLTSIAFSDTLPSGLSISDSTTSQCGGMNNLTTTAATRVISLTGGSLAANSSCTFNITVTGSTAGTYNNITTTAVTAASGAVALTGGTASASIVVSDQTPSIDLTKQVSTGAGPWTKYVAVAAGSSVYYRFKVYNSGDTALYNIGIIETIGSINPTCSWPSPLAVGDTAYCVSGAVTAVAGSNVNTAYATAKYPSGGATYNSANSSATYATTALTLAKNATETYFTAAGNVLHYSYVVTNSGYAILTGPATVADNKSTDESCPALATIGDNDNYFDPSESVTCTATYTVIAADVTAGQVTNTATATVGGATSPAANKTVSLAMPSLTVVKSVQPYSDPINGTTSPKAIPGSFMTYTILVTNTGPGAADNNTTVITDTIPANTELFVGDIDGAGPVSGPVSFTDGASCSAGTAVSGLSYSFIGLTDTTDNLLFSKSSGATYDNNPGDLPVADGNECDTAVTHTKVSLSGPFNGTVASGGSSTSFCLQFRVRVK